MIEFEGHLQQRATGDCLVELHDGGVNVKFLGSYPVHGGAASARQGQEETPAVSAQEWLADLRAKGASRSEEAE